MQCDHLVRRFLLRLIENIQILSQHGAYPRRRSAPTAILKFGHSLLQGLASEKRQKRFSARSARLLLALCA